MIRFQAETSISVDFLKRGLRSRQNFRLAASADHFSRFGNGNAQKKLAEIFSVDDYAAGLRANKRGSVF